MNILFLCDEYPPGPHGGIGTAVQLLARALAKAGHEVVVAGFYDWGYGGADAEKDGLVQVYRFRRRGSGAWAQNRKALVVRAAYRIFRKTHLLQWSIQKSLPEYHRFLDKIIDRHRIEVAEISDFQDYTQHLSRKTPLPRLPIPYVVKLHGSITNCNAGTQTPTPDAIFETEKQLLQNAAGVIAVSRFALAETEKLFGLSLPAIVIPNGLDLSPFPQKRPSKNLQKVVFSGTLVALKGIYQLMKAWNQVVEKVPQARLDVYGKGALNHILPLLSPKSREQVTFHGHVSREALLESLQDAAIGVFPSYTETFGLAAAEAMASGCAVVYTSRAAGPELIAQGRNGLLIDPDDVEALADSLIHLLQNPELCQTLGQNALETARRQFDISQQIALHTDFYKKIIRDTASK